MQQITQTSMGSERYRKTTHRAQFLEQMHQMVPWATLCALLSMGTIVDASLTRASSWLQRQDLSCDRERHNFREVAADASP